MKKKESILITVLILLFVAGLPANGQERTAPATDRQATTPLRRPSRRKVNSG